MEMTVGAHQFPAVRELPGRGTRGPRATSSGALTGSLARSSTAVRTARAVRGRRQPGKPCLKRRPPLRELFIRDPRVLRPQGLVSLRDLRENLSIVSVREELGVHQWWTTRVWTAGGAVGVRHQ